MFDDGAIKLPQTTHQPAQNMPRPFNFSAGPAALPLPVLQKTQQQLLDWHGQGCSVLEISHRSEAFLATLDKSKNDLRQLLDIPDTYEILFLQGGAQLQFSMVPMNLLGPSNSVCFADTGHWSKKAMEQTRVYADVHVICDAIGKPTKISRPDQWECKPFGAAYCHMTYNETINGIEFPKTPLCDVPLVADMSSTLLSRPIDVSKYALIYACAQKNIGPAGVTVVIVDPAALQTVHAATPFISQYKRQISQNSLCNTAPTFAIDVCGLVFEHLIEQGGLAAAEKRNQEKASRLYQAIDDSAFYTNTIDSSCRSLMNIPFRCHDPLLEPLFIEQAAQAGLLGLKGHHAAGGGMRASLYNAMPLEGVLCLIAFMDHFAEQHKDSL